MKSIKADLFKVILPQDNHVRFSDIIDLKNQKEDLMFLVEYIKNRKLFTADFMPYLHQLIIGETGCGKKTLITALAGEAGVPIMIVPFFKLCDKDNMNRYFKQIYKQCSRLDNCILFFDDIIYIVAYDEELNHSLIQLLSMYLIKYPSIMTFASSSQDIHLPEFIREEGNFEKKMTILPPELKVREDLFKKFCSEYKFDNNINFNSIAKDTVGLTGGKIKNIIKSSFLLALKNSRDFIIQDDIDEIVSKYLYGEKRKKATDLERKLTAYHEAGHAVAGYFNGINEFTKIDIIHREESLGLTIFETDEDKYTWTKTDFAKLIICYLGGLAAERIIIGSNSSGVSEDLHIATNICSSMICCYGMDDNFGPINILSDIEYPELNKQADLIIQKYMKEYLQTALETISKHRAELEILAKTLIEKEIVLVDEMIEMFNKINS